MNRFLGLTPGTADIYIPEGKHESSGIETSRYIEEYEHWHLVLQPEDNRRLRGAASGLLIAKREVTLVTDLSPEEWSDLTETLRDGEAPRKLCEAADVTFTGHFTGPAFNNGTLAGQTQAQVHAHLYPVIEEALPEPGTRNGMGAMVEALREQQTK